MTSPISPYWRVPQTPVIIGLSGYARSGKDTVAQILVDKAGFERITFAAALKEAVRVLNPIIGGDDDCEEYRVQDALRDHGPERTKEIFPEYRRLLQVMGTEVGRNLFGDNFWVDIAFKDVKPSGRYVITDARFPNEYDAVKLKLGQMWRIKREGFGPVNDHPSETSLDSHAFDEWIENNEGLDYLELQIDRLIKEHLWHA